MSEDEKRVECKVCDERYSPDELETHVIENHPNFRAIVQQNHPDIYEENKKVFNISQGTVQNEDHVTIQDDYEEDESEDDTESVTVENAADPTESETESSQIETEVETNKAVSDYTEDDPEEPQDSQTENADNSVTEDDDVDSEPFNVEKSIEESSESNQEPTQESIDESRSNETKKSKSKSANPASGNSATPQEGDFDVTKGDTDSNESQTNQTKQNNTPEENRVFEVDGFLDDSGGREKWFGFGIGGCGGNIVDALILRAEHLRDKPDHPLSDAWEGAIRGLAVLNADANSELASTYWAQQYKDVDPSIIGDNYKIGPPEYQGSGNVEQNGDEFASWSLKQDENNDFGGTHWGEALQPNRIDEAQGVMLFHSAVKGTGTGATPTIAQALNEDVLTSRDDLDLALVDGSSVFSSVILPSMGNLSSDDKRNGLVGMARLADAIDAIIPFDNDHLLNASDDLRVNLADAEGIQMKNHQGKNEILISFLETMSLTSAAPSDDQPQNLGDQVDVQDIYNPAKDLLPRRDDLPAVLLAPAYGHINPDGDISPAILDELVSDTLINGKLVNFDHQTAWGGAFLVAHSGEYEELSTIGKRNLREILAKEEYLNFDLKGTGEMVPTSDYYVRIPGTDGIRLCGLIYNPQMPRLQSWRDWAEEIKGTNNPKAPRIEDVWDKVENLFELLGRQNMPGYEGDQ